MVPVDLAGKKALVTGASQGIGANVASLLAEAGADVAVNYFRDDVGLNRKNAEGLVRAIGARAVAVEADVRDARAVSGMFEECMRRFGKLDIVVSNAGIIRDRTIRKMSEEEWREVVETNLTGTFHVCREAALKTADGGRIVTLSSISAVVGLPVCGQIFSSRS